MSNLPLKSYINGEWVLPATSTATVDAVNPATEEVCAVVAVCGRDDVDLAVTAARAAFDAYAATSLEHRIALVEKLITIFERRYDEMVTAISTEMGAPYDFGTQFRAGARFGPRAVREASTLFSFGHGGAYDHEDDVTYLQTDRVRMVDIGDADIGDDLGFVCGVVHLLSPWVSWSMRYWR